MHTNSYCCVITVTKVYFINDNDITYGHTRKHIYIRIATEHESIHHVDYNKKKKVL